MNINFLTHSKIVSDTVYGSINIQDGILVNDNITISYNENLKHICFKEQKHLIDILLELKIKLEKKILHLLKENIYINKYVKYILSDEWLLSINPVNLIDKNKINFEYSDYYKLELQVNDITSKDGKDKKLLKDLITLQKILINICKEIEPTYMYILIDLCAKNKIDYLKYNNISDNKLKLKGDINVRFINYIQVINLIRKELNYLINNCQSMIKILK